MSEHITHIGVYDDTVRLIGYSSKYTNAFKDSLKLEYDSGWIACGSNGGHLWAVPLLQEYRDKYKAGDHSRETLRKISAAIGWITHRAADLVQKPLEKIINYEKHPVYDGREQSAYFDTIVFREVFQGGKYSPNPIQPLSEATLAYDMERHLAATSFRFPDIEIPFSHWYLNELLSLHGFIKCETNFEAWFDMFMSVKQKFSEDLVMYIDGYNNPDPAKTEKYIDTFRYYNGNDDIIRLAHSIRDGKVDNSIRFEVSLDAANCQSAYARMLQISCIMLLYASDYFDGKIDKSTLYDVLNIYGHERI